MSEIEYWAMFSELRNTGVGRGPFVSSPSNQCLYTNNVYIYMFESKNRRFLRSKISSVQQLTTNIFMIVQ